MARGRRKALHRTRRSRTKALAVVVGILLVVGAGGAAWAWVGPDLGRPDAASPKPATEAKSAPSPPPTVKSDAVDEEALRACVTAYDDGEKAVEAARNSVGDWAAHIRAMDDLESGKHSEEHTKGIWTETRLRGPDRVTKFLKADDAYKQARDACADIKQSDLSAGQRAAFDDCKDVGEQVDTALAAADDSISEWRGHLENMAARRAGNLDPDIAMSKWLAAYEKAPANIQKFQAAEKAYDDTSVTCSEDRV
jgi:hypothetical protein